jgi:anti-sigma B factor antagonist
MQRFATSPVLTYDVHLDRDGAVVRLHGDFDLVAAPHVEAILGEVLESAVAGVVVDLRGLQFIDSAGVHTLLAAQRSAERRACALSLVRGRRRVHRVFELTATEPLFTFDRGPGTR